MPEPLHASFQAVAGCIGWLGLYRACEWRVTELCIRCQRGCAQRPGRSPARHRVGHLLQPGAAGRYPPDGREVQNIADQWSLSRARKAGDSRRVTRTSSTGSAWMPDFAAPDSRFLIAGLARAPAECQPKSAGTSQQCRCGKLHSEYTGTGATQQWRGTILALGFRSGGCFGALEGIVSIGERAPGSSRRVVDGRHTIANRRGSEGLLPKGRTAVFSEQTAEARAYRSRSPGPGPLHSLRSTW